MSKERFWTKSYDEGLTDLHPREWETSYTEAIRPTIEKYPNDTALDFLGVKITFDELDRYSNQFANLLIENGFEAGDIVGIDLPNTPQYVIAWLGTLKAGCVVSGVSPLLSAPQMEYQLSDLGSGGRKVGLVTLDAIFEGRLTKIASNLPRLKLAVTTNVVDFLPKFKQFLAKLLKKVPTGKVTPLKGVKVVSFMDVLRSPSTRMPDVKVGPDDLAYIQYTGGTTGFPKGAMLTHRNSVSDLLAVQKFLSWEKGHEVALSCFPFFHIAGIFFCINCIYLGWTQILVPNPRDTDHICNKIKEYKPKVLVNVPSLFQMLMKNPRFKRLDHSKLDVCMSAAAPFPVDSQKELESIVGKGKLLELYGMTETSPITTMNPYARKRKLGSIGLPIINTDIKLVDPATNLEVPIGQAGEICIKGPQVMKGYHGKPEETRNVIDEEGFMHTGDVGVFDEEGYLKIVDRTKDMIIVGGFKVFSTKLEEDLSRHPAIGFVAAIGVPNPDRPGSEIVKVVMTINPDYAFDGNEKALEAGIMKFAKERCAPYEVPKIIEIRKELPLTAVGKVDKKVLRKESRQQ